MRKAGVSTSVSGAKVSRPSSKRVRFGAATAPAAAATKGSTRVVTAPVVATRASPPTSSAGDAPSETPRSLGSFVRQVRQFLRRRPDDYRDFATAVAAILEATNELRGVEKCNEGRAARSPTKIIDCIEKIVSLIGVNVDLVAGLSAVLPPGFSIDIQPDAIVVKVFDADGDWSMIDTGHCRVVDEPTPGPSPAREQSWSSRGRRPTTASSYAPQNQPRVVNGHHSSTPDRSAVVSRRNNDQLDSFSTSTSRPMSAAVLGGVFSTGVERVHRGSDVLVRSTSSPVRSRRASADPSHSSRRTSNHRRGNLARTSDAIRTSGSVTLLRQLQARRPVSATRAARKNKMSTSMSKSGGTTYLADVKRALSRRPDVYRKFVEVLKRYHEQRVSGGSANGSSEANRNDVNGDGGNGINRAWENAADDEEIDDANLEIRSTGSELETIREVVQLLRTRPQLVLAFNDYLPDGYRIRMFDESAYVIEHPRPSVVTGTSGISAGIGRLTVTV